MDDDSLVYLLRPRPRSPLPLHLPLRGEPDICIPGRGYKPDDDCVAYKPYTVSALSVMT